MRQAQVLTACLFGLIALLMGCNSMQTSSAILRFQQGEFDLADSLCREALKVNPDDGEAYFYMALSQSMMENYKDAYFNFEKAAELKPDRAEIARQNIESNFVKAYNRGVEASQGGQNENAIDDFTIATEADPGNPLGYTNLGKAYWVKAENLRAAFPTDYVEYGNLAIENFEIGLKKETNPERGEATAQAMANVLGHLYVDTDADVRGIYLTKYRNFTSELPGLFSPHESFATVLYDEGVDQKQGKRQFERYKEFFVYAGEAYSKAADLRKSLGDDNVDVPFFAGIAYFNAEMFAEAAVYLDSAVKLVPMHDQAWLFLQYSYFKVGNYDECIKAGRFQDETLGTMEPQVFQLIWQSYRDMARAADDVGNAADFTENKRLYEDYYIKFATYKGNADTTPPPLESKVEIAARERKENALYSKDDVAIIEASIEGNFIRGIVLNKSDDTMEYIEIHVDLLDAQGEVLSSTLAEVEDLRPGVETSFDAAFIDDDIDHFEITDVIID